jgi:anti-sigma-K factor RskA
MMAYSEDHIALAAEFALGTLDADERAQVETMMSVDKDFTAMVAAWEQKLAALNQMVGSVEPRPLVWDNIKTAIGLSEPQAPLMLPQAPTSAAAIVTERAGAIDTSNVIQMSGRIRRLRNIATFATALAAALVAMLAVQVFQPDLLPEGIRPTPRTQMVEVKTPSTAPAPSAQYVALLQKDSGSPAFILTVDGATKNFTVRKVGATSADPGKSFELWLISDKLPQPRSLGVIGSGDFTARPVLASYDANTVNNATYAVTVEQAGGSPNGKPTSPPIFSGKLIESVPAAAPTAAPKP